MHSLGEKFRVRGPLLSLAISSLAVCWQVAACGQDPAAQAAIEQQLLDRVQADPDSSSSWRLLGRLRLARRDVDGALSATEKAVELEPTSASAQFDLARALMADQREDAAAEHFYLAYQIAPDSEYGLEARRQLDSIGWPAPPSFSALGENDATPNRFAGALTTPRNSESDGPFRATLEMGGVYNSNVQLAPISRVVSSPGLGSAQAYLAPEFDRRFASGADWSLGTQYQSYFNLNEGELAEFDLQEYKPGFYWERSFPRDETEWLVRFQYDFILDQFAGSTLATRHAWTGLLDRLDDSRDTVLYWSIDLGNYVDDGPNPSVDSLDGWTNTIGASRTWLRDQGMFSLVRCGSDLQWAPLEGSDFAYRGIFAYLEGEMPTYADCVLAVQLGGGYRNYPDFSGSPSRDEGLYRARVELRKAISPHCEIVAMASYDRFACANDQFDTYRFLSGVVSIIRY